MSDQGDRGERDLVGMAGSYRAQTGHLTRTIKKAAALVKEAALRAPSTIFLDELKRALAEVRDQQEKCADICEDIRDAQEKSDEKRGPHRRVLEPRRRLSGSSGGASYT
jgi:hypothetical protein